jgi:hypothetical protein
LKGSGLDTMPDVDRLFLAVSLSQFDCRFNLTGNLKC